MDDLKLFGKTGKQVKSLINTVHIYSERISKEFGINKCGILMIQKGKLVHIVCIEFSSDENIKEIDQDSGYEYLGILEADDTKDNEMETLATECIRKILKSHLNSRSVITAINSRAVSFIGYETRITGQRQNELKDLDRKTRKLMTLYGVFHKKSDVNTLYIKRAEGVDD